MLTVELTVYSLCVLSPHTLYSSPRNPHFQEPFSCKGWMLIVLWGRMIESVVPALSYHTVHSYRQHCWLFRWSVQYLTHDSLFSGGTNTYGALAKGKAVRASLCLWKFCHYLLNGIMNKWHKFILHVGELVCIPQRECDASISPLVLSCLM